MAYLQNLILQTGNGQNFLTWNLVAGVTAYTVQRSTDGVNFTTIATPATNYYLDPAVNIQTNYFYQVGATATPTGFS